jgi:hypothetical protein
MVRYAKTDRLISCSKQVLGIIPINMSAASN